MKSIMLFSQSMSRTNLLTVTRRAAITIAAFALGFPGSQASEVFAGESSRAIYDCGVSNFVMHAVQIQSPMDDAPEFVRLRGPRHVVAPESAMAGSGSEKAGGKAVLPDLVSGPAEYFSVYEIGSPRQRESRSASIEFDGKPIRVTIGNAVALWMPAQAIRNGPASDLPETATFRLVFEIESHDDAIGEKARLAVPCQYWHHEENTPIANQTAFLLRGVQNPSAVEKLTIIDGFGLNELTVTGQSASVQEVSVRFD